MILTEADTLLSLEEFRRILQYNPYRFWQLDSAQLQPPRHACDDLLYEFDWQSADAISRTAMRHAIARAEGKLAEFLGYDVAPRYRTETRPYPPLAQEVPTRGAPIDARGRWVGVRLDHGHVQRVGYRRSTLIGVAALTFSSRRGNGINDTFTATVTTSVTDPEQIACYVAAADRWDPSLPDADYRIRPVSVSIASGQATITGPIWLVVNPREYSDVTGAAPLDLSDPATYLTQIAVHREYIDPDGTTVDDAQCTLLWETAPWPLWACAATTDIYTPNASDPAAIGKAAARAGIRDATLGIIGPGEAVRDATTGEWRQVEWSTWYEPDRVEVRYLAGLNLVDRQMRAYWQQTVAYLALAELEGPICACEGVRKRLHHWQFDLARTGGANDESYGAISAEDLANPFGTRRGQVEAWKRVSARRTLIGFAL
jgi:hypothetical protein